MISDGHTILLDYLTTNYLTTTDAMIASLQKHKIMEEQKKKNTFELILKIIIAVASAIAGALGATACKGLF